MDFLVLKYQYQNHNPQKFENKQLWNLEHFIGYLNTWSAVKHYIKQNDENPINKLEIELKEHWKENEIKDVKFPILLRIGKIKTGN